MRLIKTDNILDVRRFVLGDNASHFHDNIDRTIKLPPGIWHCTAPISFDWTAITGYEQGAAISVGWTLGNSDIDYAFAWCELDPNSITYFASLSFLVSSVMPMTFYTRETSYNSPSGAGGYGWHRFGARNILTCKRIG